MTGRPGLSLPAPLSYYIPSHYSIITPGCKLAQAAENSPYPEPRPCNPTGVRKASRKKIWPGKRCLSGIAVEQDIYLCIVNINKPLEDMGRYSCSI